MLVRVLVLVLVLVPVLVIVLVLVPALVLALAPVRVRVPVPVLVPVPALVRARTNGLQAARVRASPPRAGESEAAQHQSCEVVVAAPPHPREQNVHCSTRWRADDELAQLKKSRG